MTSILSNRRKRVLLLLNCFMCNMINLTKKYDSGYIRSAFKLMNLLVYAYNGTIFFKLFTAQDLTPILNKMSNDYVTRMSRDDRQLTFCANKRGEWE